MSHRTRDNFPAGFTLIELILVLALMALIATVTVPLVANFQNGQRSGNVADQIVALAGWARTQAIARGVSFRLNVDPAHGKYWLTMQNGASYENVLQNSQGAQLGLAGGTGTVTQFAAPGDEMGMQFTAPTGVRMSCSFQPQPDGQYVEFHSTGRCDPGTIQISDGTRPAIEVGCLSATENYHVLSDDEKKTESTLLQTPVVAPAR